MNTPKHVIAQSKSQSLTIVVPHFNQSDFLREIIESLAEQQFNFTNLTVVDDKSAPNHINKVRRLKDKWNFNLIEHDKNRGLPATRNTGSAASNSEHVFFLDSDDLFESSYLKMALELHQNNSNVAAVGCWIKCFGENEDVIPTFDGISDLTLYKNTLNSASLVWKRSILIDLGGFDESMKAGYEDYDLACRAISKGYAIPVIDEPIFFYRVRRKSMFQSMSHSLHNFQYESIIQKLDFNNFNQAKNLMKLTRLNGNPVLLTSIFSQNNLGKNYESSASRLRRMGWRHPILKRLWSKLPLWIKSKIYQMWA